MILKILWGLQSSDFSTCSIAHDLLHNLILSSPNLDSMVYRYNLSFAKYWTTLFLSTFIILTWKTLNPVQSNTWSLYASSQIWLQKKKKKNHSSSDWFNFKFINLIILTYFSRKFMLPFFQKIFLPAPLRNSNSSFTTQPELIILFHWENRSNQNEAI